MLIVWILIWEKPLAVSECGDGAMATLLHERGNNIALAGYFSETLGAHFWAGVIAIPPALSRHRQALEVQLCTLRGGG
jgi:hypothetical protein